MIDTHCHLYLPHFRDDLDDVLKRASSENITDICLPANGFESLSQMDKLHHDAIRFHKMAGLHPCEFNEGMMLNEKRLWEECSKDTFVAVGETGLDYYWSKDFILKQKRSLHLHCEISKSTKKPIVLHNRDATNDLLDIIETEQDGSLFGVWHCFTGSVDEGKRAIDLGLMLGIGGVVTFKNGGVDKSVAELPLQSMILETDSPYLAPAPYRGKRNEPSFTALVARKLAEIFDLDLSEIDSITTNNAKRLFRI